MTQPTWGTGSPAPVTGRRRPVADVFDETFRLYRKHFRTMVVVFGAFQLPFVLLSLPLWGLEARWMQDQYLRSPTELLSMDELGLLVAATVGLTLAAIPLGTFGAAGIAHLVRRARTGERPTARDVFRALGKDAADLLGLAVLIIGGAIAVVLGLGVLVVALFAVAGPVAAIALSVLGFVGLFVALMVVAVRLALSVPALVVERRGPLDALRRSWALVAGSTLRTFGIFVLGSLVVGIVSGIVNPVFLPEVTAGLAAGAAWSYALLAVVTGLAGILVGPILPTVLTVLYFDYAAGESTAVGGA